MSQVDKVIDEYGIEYLQEVYRKLGRPGLADVTGLRYNSVGHLCKAIGVYNREDYLLQIKRLHDCRWETRNPFIEDTDTKWYLVGYFMGDGSLRQKKDTKKWYASIASSDEQIISDISKTMDNLSWEYSKGCYQITTGNGDIIKSLREMGFVSNKSVKGCNVSIPDRWFYSYLRGLMDSDGYVREVSSSNEITWHGHISYIKDIAEKLGRPMHARESIMSVSVLSKEDICKVVQLMYKDCEICLERKRDRCLRILNHYGIQMK